MNVTRNEQRRKSQEATVLMITNQYLQSHVNNEYSREWMSDNDNNYIMMRMKIMTRGSALIADAHYASIVGLNLN